MIFSEVMDYLETKLFERIRTDFNLTIHAGFKDKKIIVSFTHQLSGEVIKITAEGEKWEECFKNLFKEVQ